ncbi:hypothetical protein D3C73_1005260 [compost metagenome]
MVCSAPSTMRVWCRLIEDSNGELPLANFVSDQRGGSSARPSSASWNAPDSAAMARRSSSFNSPSATSICTAMPSLPLCRVTCTLTPLAVAMRSDTALSG